MVVIILLVPRPSAFCILLGGSDLGIFDSEVGLVRDDKRWGSGWIGACDCVANVVFRFIVKCTTTESRKDGGARSSSSAEEGDRKVLTSNGGCVNKGSASSSSSSTWVAALEPSSSLLGWRRCMTMEARRSVRLLHVTTRRL